MGEAANAELSFIVDGRLKSETFRRWGQSDRGFDSFDVTAPAGLERAPAAVAVMLQVKAPQKIGYIRIRTRSGVFAKKSLPAGD